MRKICVHIGKGMTRRITALLLATIMVATISPPVTAAGVTDSGKILLSGFAELPENIRRQSVPLGVSLGELNLPDTMTATVGAASVDAEPTPDTEPEEPKDSGAATMLTEDAPTLGTSDEPASKGEIIEENDVPLAASPSDAEDKAAPDAGADKTVIISGITWESDPLYDSETEGTYIFTAVLPSGYTMEDGAAMPVITVVVGQAEQSAVDKVIAMIDALPTMEEWQAMDEAAARAVMEKILAAKKAYDALTAEEKAQIDETRTAKLLELAEMAQQLANTMLMANGDRLEFTSDSPSVSGTGYEWVKDTKTLTLNGYTATSGGAVGIQVPDGATLVVNGTNSIIVTGSHGIASNASHVGNDGILCGSYTGSYNEATLGVLTIEGNGTLAINCAYTASEMDTSWGMRATSITMNGGTVICTANKARNSYGVLAEDAITINGGSLSVTGERTTEFGNDCYGVYMVTGNITVNSGGTLTGIGNTGVMMNDLTVDGGTVIGIGKNDSTQNIGIAVNNDLTINSGSLTGTAEDSTDMSAGVGVARYFDVYGGTITATSGTAAVSSAVMSVNPPNLDGGVAKCNIGGNTGYADETNFAMNDEMGMYLVYEGDTQTTIATDVKLYGPPPATPALIFEEDTHSETGDGYEWVQDTKTLTLNGYTSTNISGAVGIQVPDGATLVVNGTNSLIVTGAHGIASNASHVGNDGILCGSYGSPYNTATLGALTIEGNGTLAVTCAYTGSENMESNWGMRAKSITMKSGTVTCTGDKARDSYGVLAEDALIINGGSLSCAGGEAIESSYGVYTNNGSITVNSGGTLTGTGESSGYRSTGVSVFDLTVDGGSVVGVGGSAPYLSIGVEVKNILNVNSGSLTATGGTVEADGMSSAVSLVNAPTIGADLVIGCNSAGNTGYTGETNVAYYDDWSEYLVYEGTDQTTVATDVKIYKPLQPGLLDNPLTQEKVDGAFGVGNATLEGSTITLNSSVVLNNTIIFDGVTATLDTKTFTITGKVGANGSTGHAGSNAITINPSATVTITGDQGGKIIGGKGGDGESGGNGGSGVRGNVTVSGSVSTNGGNGGSGTSGDSYGVGGNGVQGNVTISGRAAITGGLGFGISTKAVSGTITAGTAGIVIMGSDNMTTNVIPSGDTSNYPYIKSADPDIATVVAAKTAAENATYTATTQGTTGSESAAQAYVQNIAATAVNNSGVTVTVNKVSYTAPVEGTSSDRDGTNGSYIFTITVSKGSQSQTTKQVTIAITATAYSGSTGGDGGGGGGGSTGSGTTTPPTSKPTEPVTGNTENKATVDDKGNANVSISDKNITDAITNAKAEADKKGVNAGEITAVINVTTGGKDATTVSVNLPKVVQEQVIDSKIAKVELVIDRPDLTIGMNLSAVTEINKQANADVQISASKTNAAALSADAKAAIGNRPAYDLKATYQSGGKSVTNFGTGTVSIEIPYKLQSGENAGNIYAVYVDGNGKVTYLTSSSYDAKRETLVFTTNHFSVYGVGFKATSSKFTDTADHWAKDSIDFVVSRRLMNGTSSTTFSPNDAMTRGMFVTTLGRLSGADVSGYKASSFSDVAADAYYMGYIEWANKNNIVVGIGGGKFAPDTLVTREQMAVIMDRYATAIGFKLPEVHAANTFADNAKIGGWSAESVKRIQMAGVITGKTGNVFDPQGTATRAEVSAVIKRFVELAAFNNTAQGWMMNDSGKWMYYENGKPVTGTKNIDGTTYTFNSYGEIADTPKKLTYGTYTVKKGDSWWKIAREQNCNMYELARVNGKTIFSFIYEGDVLKVPQQ